MEEMIPAKVLNEVFVDKLDDGSKARDAALRYVYDRTRSLPHPPEGLVVGLHKTANIVKLSINALVNGRKVGGSKEWAEIFLLTTNVPITHLFDEVINSVFEVPSEGTSVS